MIPKRLVKLQKHTSPGPTEIHRNGTNLYILIAILLAVPTAASAVTSFENFIHDLRSEARKQGISLRTLDSALTDLTPNPQIIALYNRQPEKKQGLSTYMDKRVSSGRVHRGQVLIEDHRVLLNQVAEKFGVQPRFIVALWGSESSFGQHMGDFSVIRSLATLAHGSKRRDYFRRELLVALRIIDQGDIQADQMLGSWAGAMGQCQFMPWSYDRRAVDFDGDGRRNIWSSRADVFASIANYLASQGWRDDQTWGREVLLPANLERKFKNQIKDLQEWQDLGIRRLNGSALPTRHIDAKLIRPANAHGRSFLVYGNFDVLLKWNRSNHFAIAVGTLADRLRP